MPKNNKNMKETKETMGRNALRNVRKFFPSVTSVVDAKETASIEVTDADVSSADIKKHDTCALAVACKRKLHLDGVIVSIKMAYLIKGKQAIRYGLPESASREIVSFDRKGGFEPGEYRLDVPSPSQRLDYDWHGGRHTGKVTKSSFHRHITQNIRTALGSKDA